MNDGNGRGNNPLNGEQNNIMAQVLIALAQALRNLQPALVQGWAKRFDAACLTYNWRLARQKDIARSFLDGPAFQ